MNLIKSLNQLNFVFEKIKGDPKSIFDFKGTDALFIYKNIVQVMLYIRMYSDNNSYNVNLNKRLKRLSKELKNIKSYSMDEIDVLSVFVKDLINMLDKKEV